MRPSNNLWHAFVTFGATNRPMTKTCRCGRVRCPDCGSFCGFHFHVMSRSRLCNVKRNGSARGQARQGSQSVSQSASQDMDTHDAGHVCVSVSGPQMCLPVWVWLLTLLCPRLPFLLPFPGCFVRHWLLSAISKGSVLSSK